MMQISGLLADAPAFLSAAGGYNSKQIHLFPESYSFSLYAASAGYQSFCFGNPGFRSSQRRVKNYSIKASSDSSGRLVPLAPLQLESPVGQFLVEILRSHPHLLPAALDEQLDSLQKERDTKSENPSSQDLLYKRISEVKEKDRRRAVEDILYCLIVHKFVDKQIAMIPKISPTSDPTGRVDFWPNQEQELERVHSPEAFDMVLSHLAIILGERVVGPLDTIIEMSKIKLGKLYAASIMYGYFLKRVDERYQLDRSMNTLPEGFEDKQADVLGRKTGKQLWDPESLMVIMPDEGDGGGVIEPVGEAPPNKLKSYVMHLDAETLQRYATIRSGEAISLIEKQTQALFGRPDIKVTDDGSLDASNDEVISVTFSGLTLLVLEAVTFGSFLWDAEGYVESRYSFLKS